MSFFNAPFPVGETVPPRADHLLRALGWFPSHSSPPTYQKLSFGQEYHTWSEAICMELLEFVEGMKT